MASPGPTSQLPAAQLVHDSDSEIVDGSELASPIQVKNEQDMVVLTQLGRNDMQQFVTDVDPVCEPDAQRAEIASFLQSCAGQEMMRALEMQHEEKLTEVKNAAEEQIRLVKNAAEEQIRLQIRLARQPYGLAEAPRAWLQAQAQQAPMLKAPMPVIRARMPVPPIPDLLEPTGPPTTQRSPPSVAQRTTTIGDNSKVPWPSRGPPKQGKEMICIDSTAPPGAGPQPGDRQWWYGADQQWWYGAACEERHHLQPAAVRAPPLEGGQTVDLVDESTAKCVTKERSVTLTNFWCKTCETKILANHRRGDLVWWLTANEDQEDPVPIESGYPKTTRETPTAENFEHREIDGGATRSVIGSRKAMETLMNLGYQMNLARTGQNSDILKVEPSVPTSSPGTSSSSVGPASSSMESPDEEHLNNVTRSQQTAVISPQDLQGSIDVLTMRSQWLAQPTFARN